MCKTKRNETTLGVFLEKHLTHGDMLWCDAVSPKFAFLSQGDPVKTVSEAVV